MRNPIATDIIAPWLRWMRVLTNTSGKSNMDISMFLRVYRGLSYIYIKFQSAKFHYFLNDTLRNRINLHKNLLLLTSVRFIDQNDNSSKRRSAET